MMCQLCACDDGDGDNEVDDGDDQLINDGDDNDGHMNIAFQLRQHDVLGKEGKRLQGGFGQSHPRHHHQQHRFHRQDVCHQ